ncbi:MAG TPA: hypothetical protein PLH57_09120, partial [Oligoflexia bacterium]|nr:hypothetical protein [Oligoflexia bacterium]
WTYDSFIVMSYFPDLSTRTASILAALTAVAAGNLFGACSLEPIEDTASAINIRIENEPPGLLAMLGDPFQINAPTQPSDFNCFAVNVTGDGITPSASIGGCVSSDNFNGTGPGITSRHFLRGTAATIYVPAGDLRRVDVYGFYPSTPECGGSAGAVYSGYFVGSKSIKLAEGGDVSIPISYSGANASVSCSEPEVNLIPTHVRQRNTTSSVCTFNSSAPPTFPTPPSGPIIGPSDTNYLVEDGNLNVSECDTAPTETMDIQFRFDATGLDLSTFGRMEVHWKGRGGTSGTGCNGSASQTLTTGGATAWLYEVSTDSWIQIGSASGTSVQLQGGDFFQPLSRFVTSNYIFLRVVTPQLASGCAIIHTDVARIRLVR